MSKMTGKIGKNEYPRVSNTLVVGTVISYIAFLLLLMAFCSPYWIKSYENSWSEFTNMGLWEYCFRDYMFPYYQFPKMFEGCNNIFSNEYYPLREFLLPGWLIVVQICVTLAFVIVFICLGLMSLALIRWPLESVLTYEWVLVRLSWIGITCSSILLFVAVSVFGGNAYRRDWLMYPKFNVLSWSYIFAVISCILLTMSSIILYKESKRSYNCRREGKNLVTQIQMQEHGFHSGHPAQLKGPHGYI